MTQSRTFKTAILGSGRFLASLTMLITIIVLSRVLTKTGYAAYRQTILIFMVAAPLLKLGLPEALYYFLPREKENSRSIISSNLFLLFCMGGLFAIFLWFGGIEFIARKFDNPVLKPLLLIFSPYAFFALPILAIDACLVSFDKVKILTVYNIASRIFILSWVISLALVFRTPESAVYGTVISTFLIFIPAIFLMYKYADSGKNWTPKISSMKDQLGYSVPLGLATFIGIISINLDKILVSALRPPEEFAVYANGAIEIPLIGIITGSVMSILIPEFSVLYKNKETLQIVSLWHRAMRKCALIIFPTMVFLFIMAPEIIRLLFSNKYINSMYPFRVYLLLLPIRITQFGAIFMSSGRNKLILYRSIIAIIANFFLSIFLIKKFGAIGAAIGTVLVIYLWTVPYNLISIKEILKVRISNSMPFLELFKVFVISLGGGIVFFFNPLFKSYPAIFPVVVLGSLYFGLVLFLFTKLSFIKIPVFPIFKRR